MRSIFQDPTKGPATRGGQAVGSLTGPKDQPPTADRGVSVRHVPQPEAGKN